MIETACTIVMQMDQDNCVDIAPRVNLHIVQTCSDLFMRRHFDVDFLGEEWISPRQIAGHGVPHGVTRVDDEAAFGVLD